MARLSRSLVKQPFPSTICLGVVNEKRSWVTLAASLSVQMEVGLKLDRQEDTRNVLWSDEISTQSKGDHNKVT